MSWLLPINPTPEQIAGIAKNGFRLYQDRLQDHFAGSLTLAAYKARQKSRSWHKLRAKRAKTKAPKGL